jgi:hypothetical protein
LPAAVEQSQLVVLLGKNNPAAAAIGQHADSVNHVTVPTQPSTEAASLAVHLLGLLSPVAPNGLLLHEKCPPARPLPLLILTLQRYAIEPAEALFSCSAY